MYTCMPQTIRGIFELNNFPHLANYDAINVVFAIGNSFVMQQKLSTSAHVIALRMVYGESWSQSQRDV